MTTDIQTAPHISVDGDKLIISISLSELVIAIENKGDGYKVEKPDKLLDNYEFQLKNYAQSNATEKGISELQYLFDTIADEIYINADDVITQKLNP